MTTFTNPSVSVSSSLKGQEDFMWLPGSQERPKSLRHVRRGMSCSEVRVIGVVASSNIALCFFFFFLYYQNIWDCLQVEKDFGYWQLNTVSNKIMVVTVYSHHLSHSWNILPTQRFSSLNYQSLFLLLYLC